jgi:hypothetical protein
MDYDFMAPYGATLENNDKTIEHIDNYYLTSLAI